MVRSPGGAPARHAAALGALALAACSQDAPELPAGTVEFGQCRTVIAPARCVLSDDRRVRLWIHGDGHEVRVRPESALLGIASREVVAGGERLELLLTADARQVIVDKPEGRWNLQLVAEPPSALIEAALALEDAAPSEAERRLRDAAAAEPYRGGAAWGALARMQIRAGRFESGIAALERAVEAHLDAGRTLDAARDGAALAYYLIHRQRRFAAADAVLDRVAAAQPESADAAYLLAYYRGLVAFNAGDARRALPLLRRAEERSARMGWQRRMFHSQQIRAVQLQMLGRRREAFALLDAWDEERLAGFAPCERAMFANNRAWSALLLLEAGESERDPGGALQTALPDVDTHCVVDERVNVRINLALAAWHSGDHDEARRWLGEARSLTDRPEPRMRLWSQDLAARLALAGGDADEATAAYERLERLADATLSPDAAWRATVGLANVHAMRGERYAALRQFARAEALLDEDLLRVPIHEGRESFLARRVWAMREHVELLLDTGQSEQAFALVHRERLRSLRGLRVDDRLGALEPAAQAEWQEAVGAYRLLREELAQTVSQIWVVPRDQLEALETQRAEQEARLREILDRAAAAVGREERQTEPRSPAPGELLLAFQRLDEDWAVFARTEDELRVTRAACAEDPAPTAASACLLDAALPWPAGTQRLRFLPGEALERSDLHAHVLNGQPLIAALPVVYALALPPASEDRGGREALLLSDPGGNLAGAREEVAAVSDILGGGLWQLTALAGDAVTPLAVRETLSQSDLFHFAGHARLAGTLGWDSALRFARGSELGVTDILALPRVPRFVVLSGCETGARRSADDDVAGIGLAYAFLAAGASEVLAATRPVRDDTARSLMIEYYRAWVAGVPAAVALQQAQLVLLQQDGDADWAAFRLFAR